MNGRAMIWESEMGEYEESLYRLGGRTSDYLPSPPPRPVTRERIHIQKSSVYSRAYFMVVMVFHLYITNIIALLLYVHYNTGSGEAPGGEQDLPLEKSTSAPKPIAAEHQT